MEWTTTLRNIKTFVFFDTETTGLPSYEHNKTRIVELCFAAVQTDHLSLGVFPRIIPKLSLCFNPSRLIQPGATEVSGLSNELLQEQPEFNSDAARLIQDFLNMQCKPVCLIAHNGNKFDYPILRAEFFKAGRELSGDILCIDSLLAFRQLAKDSENEVDQSKNVSINIPVEFQDGYDELLCSVLEDLKNSTDDCDSAPIVKKPLTIQEIQKRNETTPQKQILRSTNNGPQGTVRKQLFFSGCISYKLSNLYELLTHKKAIDAHRAEADVVMLIECVAKLGQRFIDYAKVNAVRLCDIPMMKPGRVIGKE